MKTAAPLAPLEYLASIPRYRNSALRSLGKRAEFFLNVLTCRLFGIVKPLWVILVTNNGCNLACDYCYGCYGPANMKQDFSTRELIEIVDELWGMGTRNLTVHGGEALIRADIGPLLNYMKHKGFYVSLNTNGVLVPKLIEQIKCVDCICVSLDGRPENNDKHRGQGCYEKAIEAMRVIVENDVPLVIHATLTKDNMNDIDYLCDLTRRMKGRLQFSILYNAEKYTADGVLNDAETRAVLQKIIDLRRRGYPVYYSEKTLRAALEWPFRYGEKYYAGRDERVTYRGRIPCYHGLLKYYLDADGSILTCWRHNYDDAPNIRTHGLKKAIELCRANNTCAWCPFLSNNEHNALFSLIPNSTWDMVVLQIQDALKITRLWKS